RVEPCPYLRRRLGKLHPLNRSHPGAAGAPRRALPLGRRWDVVAHEDRAVPVRLDPALREPLQLQVQLLWLTERPVGELHGVPVALESVESVRAPRRAQTAGGLRGSGPFGGALQVRVD